MPSVVITNSGDNPIQVNETVLNPGSCGGFLTPVSISSDLGSTGFIVCCSDPEIPTGKFYTNEYKDEEGNIISTEELEIMKQADPVSVSVTIPNEAVFELPQDKRFPHEGSINIQESIQVE